MDTLRLFVTIFNLGCIAISHTSPTVGSEMGEKRGDNIVKGGKVNRLFIRFCITMGLFSFLTYYNILNYWNVPLSILEYFAISVAFTGFNLRMWSYYTLGDMFTFTIGTREHHELITNGPYQYLVHPSYTGTLLHVFASLLFFTDNWFMGGIVIVLLLYGNYNVFKRIKIEERMMFDCFGQEYVKYVKQRWRLVPYLY